MGYKFDDEDIRFLANELGQPLEETELEVRDFENNQSSLELINTNFIFIFITSSMFPLNIKFS